LKAGDWKAEEMERLLLSTKAALTQRVDWTQEEAEVPADNTHLWEESWDDDDTSEDFSAQLKSVHWGSILNVLCVYGLEQLANSLI